MRFHSAGRSLRWGADDECIARLINASKKCGGYGHQRCACAFVCSLGITHVVGTRISLHSRIMGMSLSSGGQKKEVMIKVSGR